jgi:hypothetical protein
MNVIFLDIDGVLTTARTSIAYNESQMKTLDQVAVKMIASICKQGNVSICITSDWRRANPVRADFILNFSYNGGAPLIPYILKTDNWKTPIFNTHCDKETEINTWLSMNPGVNAKAIIDTEVLGDSLKAFHVRISPYDGYNFQNYLDTIKIIEEKALLYGNIDLE